MGFDSSVDGLLVLGLAIVPNACFIVLYDSDVPLAGVYESLCHERAKGLSNPRSYTSVA
jgi:hypothetical protein